VADNARFDLSTTGLAPVRVIPDLDPRLQLLIARRQAGEVKLVSRDSQSAGGHET
jgi:hypothetical protein